MEHLYDWTSLCVHCKQSAMDIDDGNLSCLPDEKPETEQEWQERREKFVEQRLKEQILPKKEFDPESPNLFEREWSGDGLF